MLKHFKDRKEYLKFKQSNANYIDVRYAFSHIKIRDRFDLITPEIIDKFDLYYMPDVLVNTDTGKEYEGETQYRLEHEQLDDFLNYMDKTGITTLKGLYEVKNNVK